MQLMYDEVMIRDALRSAWSLETAVQWTPENPASGQCNVTAAVIYDLFGGEILRTRLPDVWHYYNRIEGQRVDFTDSQFTARDALFSAPEPYDDASTTREAALAGIPGREYAKLKRDLLTALDRQP